MNRLIIAILILPLSAHVLWAQAPTSPTPAPPTSAAPNAVQPPGPELNEAIQKIKEGRIDEALKLIEEAAKKQPNASPPKLILARLAARAAPKQFRMFLEAAATETPDHPEIYVTFGDVALSENRISDAILNGVKALELANAPRWSPDQRTNCQKLARAILATAYERRGDWSNALTQLAAWLELEPKNSAVRTRYAETLFRVNQFDDAFREYQNAGKDDSNILPAPVLMARQFFNRGDLRKARELMQKAVTEQPNSAVIHLCFADFLLQLNELDGAKLHTETAARLDPKVPDLQQMQGLVARMSKDYAKAEAIFQALLNESPGNLNAGIQLALVLAESQDPAKVKRALERAQLNYQQSDRNTDVLTTLGYCYYRNGNRDEAKKIFTAILNALRDKPPPPDTAYFVALWLADEKDTVTLAKDVLKTALGSSGCFFYRQEAQALYDRLEKGTPTDKPKGG